MGLASHRHSSAFVPAWTSAADDAASQPPASSLPLPLPPRPTDRMAARSGKPSVQEVEAAQSATQRQHSKQQLRGAARLTDERNQLQLPSQLKCCDSKPTGQALERESDFVHVVTLLSASMPVPCVCLCVCVFLCVCVCARVQMAAGRAGRVVRRSVRVAQVRRAPLHAAQPHPTGDDQEGQPIQDRIHAGGEY